MKPVIHAKSSQSKFGGDISDYLLIHQIMDSSKAAYSNNLHRVVLHHAFGCFLIEQMFGIDYESLEKIRKKYNLPDEFILDITEWKNNCITNGKEMKNSKGKLFSPRDVAEQHCYEDFRKRFIPTLQDYIEDCKFPDWVNNGLGLPNRLKK